MNSQTALDLDVYLRRIGHRGSRAPSYRTLAALTVGHLGAIPFENIDVRLGQPVGLDLASLEAKLVRRRRGGYCFEHNTLFAAVLEVLGFEVQTLEARVRSPGVIEPRPRTHMTLAVTVEGRDYLVDVGCGGYGPLHPVPLDGEISKQPGASYHVAREGEAVRVLRVDLGEGPYDLYAFMPTPVLPIDFVVANHYTSTHPASIFMRTVTAQRSTPEVRRILRNRSYTVRPAGGEESVRDLTEAGVVRVLRDDIGLDVSAAEVVRALRATPAR